MDKQEVGLGFSRVTMFANQNWVVVESSVGFRERQD